MLRVSLIGVLAFLISSISVAGEPSVKQLRINELLNGGACGDQSCSVRVCSVEKMMCVYYQCKAGVCTAVRKEKLSKEDIDKALQEADSK